MNLITFLGTGKYESALYGMNGMQHRSMFVAEALTKFLEPQTVYVLHTQQSASKLDELRAALSPLASSIEPREIPGNMEESALWEIFHTVAELLREPAALDITHSFRAIPLLAAAVAVFAKTTSDAKIEGVFYGAFEREQAADRVTPIINMQPFLDIMEWSSALAMFKQTGDARPLSTVLASCNKDYHLQRRSDEHGKPIHLSALSGNLVNLSDALSVARPLEIPELADTLMQRLNSAADEITAYAPPLASQLSDLAKKYDWMALRSDNDTEQLQYEFTLIEWYLEHKQIMQAVTLAREWLVSLVLVRLETPLNDFGQRRSVEDALNDMANGTKSAETKVTEKMLNDIATIKRVNEAWSFVRDLRNDIAHCGMNTQHAPAKTLLKNAEKLRAKLQPLMEGSAPTQPDVR